MDNHKTLCFNSININVTYGYGIIIHVTYGYGIFYIK